MSTSTRWWTRIFLARSSTEPTISPISCRAVLGLIEPELEPGHVEQIGDEAVEPLRFLENGGDQIGLGVVIEGARQILERAGGADDGGKRGLQIVRDGREQRRAQAIGLDPAFGLVEIVHEMNALDGQRRLVDQRVEQAALVGGEKRARLVAVDADDADDAAAGAHGQKQPLGARQRIGAAAGGAIMVPGPFRRGKIGLIENVLGRIPGLDGKGAIVGQQQDDPDFEHQRRLIGARPKHVVERAGAGQLAAEGIERLGGARPGHGGYGKRSRSRRDIGHHDGHDGEEHDGDDVPRIGDGEGVVGLGEEEIVAKRRRGAGDAAKATGRSARRRRRRP